jgi:hypothetical protein
MNGGNMRAYFEGQNIFALGNGIAILRSVWKEAEQPRAKEKKKQMIRRNGATGAKSDGDKADDDVR